MLLVNEEEIIEIATYLLGRVHGRINIHVLASWECWENAWEHIRLNLGRHVKLGLNPLLFRSDSGNLLEITIIFVILNIRTYFLFSFLLYSCVSATFLLVSRERITRFSLQQKEQASVSLNDELQMFNGRAQELSSLKQEQEKWLAEKKQFQSRCDGLEEKNKELSASLEQMQARFSDRESENINDLLPPEENSVELNIISTVNAVIEEMTPYSRRSGIQLLLSSASDTLMVRADASYIHILFKNIIDNSIKYMHRNGNLVITVSNIGDDLFIVLKDNGEGLPSSETAHIFELNYQGSNRVSGNGLGLTQAKAIVEYYGGTIYAKSNSGNGMGIYIQLPAVTH